MLPVTAYNSPEGGWLPSAICDPFSDQKFLGLNSADEGCTEIRNDNQQHRKMAKRSAEEVADGNQAYLKRQKISNPVKKMSTPTEEVRSGRQLRHILAFDQDAGRSKHGIQIQACGLLREVTTKIK